MRLLYVEPSDLFESHRPLSAVAPAKWHLQPSLESRLSRLDGLTVPALVSIGNIIGADRTSS